MSYSFEISLGDFYDKEGCLLLKRGEFSWVNETMFMQGGLYITEDYIYYPTIRYGKMGWGVISKGALPFAENILFPWAKKILSSVTYRRNKSSYEFILPSIFGVSVISADYLFSNNFSIKKAPPLPRTVISMRDAFSECRQLEVPPNIPEGVIDVRGAFSCCISLNKPFPLPKSVKYDENVFLEWFPHGITPFPREQGVIDIRAKTVVDPIVAVKTPGCVFLSKWPPAVK